MRVGSCSGRLHAPFRPSMVAAASLASSTPNPGPYLSRHASKCRRGEDASKCRGGEHARSGRRAGVQARTTHNCFADGKARGREHEVCSSVLWWDVLAVGVVVRLGGNVRWACLEGREPSVDVWIRASVPNGHPLPVVK